MGTMIEVRRFTPSGLSAATELLVQSNAGSHVDFSRIVGDGEMTEQLGLQVEVRPFANRRDAAQHFYTTLEPLHRSIDVDRDRGLWSWLAILWIDLLAPETFLGERQLGETHRWILAVDDYRRYYRHLLAGPYFIYAAHSDDPDRANALLCTEVVRPGEVVGQFASRYDTVRSKGLVEAITCLYFDERTGGIRRGAAGKGAGSARRLADVLLQFDLTWDITNMTADEVLALLPAEFDQYNPLRGRAPTSTGASHR